MSDHYDAEELVALLLDDVVLLGEHDRIRLVTEDTVMEMLSTTEDAPEISDADLEAAEKELFPESDEGLPDTDDAEVIYSQTLQILTAEERDWWLGQLMTPPDDLETRSMWLMEQEISDGAREAAVQLLVLTGRDLLTKSDAELYDEVGAARRQGRADAERIVARAIERSQER